MSTPAVLLPTLGTRSIQILAATSPPAKIHHNNNKQRTSIIVYPTVSPESVIVPIVSCILGFPLLALLVICCLRRRAKLARERARRRNCGMTSAGLSLVRLGAGRSNRTASMVKARERPSLDLATVLEERSDMDSTTQLEIITPDRDDRFQIGRLLSQPARYFLEGGR